MDNTGIMLVLAYPETIVMVADEWYSPYMRYFGIGKKNYVRAGHAALVLINRESGALEYHDFGRYITPEPSGRVRGKDTDHELDFPLKANLEGDEIKNLEEILVFLATHPKFTHGEGRLIASVCHDINYQKARDHISLMQKRDFIRYAAFIKEGCNCARFVTDALIQSTTNNKIRSKLKRSKWFTPSTVGNVVIANTGHMIYELSEKGEIDSFHGSVRKENLKHFLDRLQGHVPNFEGTLHPRKTHGTGLNAQWLGGIAAGAWFELEPTEDDRRLRFRRVSPFGHEDTDGLYETQTKGFNPEEDYNFIHYSNCKFFHVDQNGKIYRYDRIAD